MVSILTGIFGLEHLETVEDAVQDTFASAVLKWRGGMPDNPEAWLTQAAKNRGIDLLRKLRSDHERISKLDHSSSLQSIDELFLDHEIADSQLKMIFTACHPLLHHKDRIAFALKTVAGFGTNEIATSLLLKNETVKKRLSRARNTIRKHGIEFAIPSGAGLQVRLESVHQVLYLIFNEGFHSGQKDMLIRKDLCGEAMRLVQLVLKKNHLRNGAGYALFALMCFHSARLEGRISDDDQVIDLKNQDRSTWYFPLIQLGNQVMHQATVYPDSSEYHYEAAIAETHLRARSYSETDWERILDLYLGLNSNFPSPITRLNIAMVLLEMRRFEEAEQWLEQVGPSDLEKRAYLYYGVMAEYFIGTGNHKQAAGYLDQAIQMVTNLAEKAYLEGKRANLFQT